MPAEGPRRLLRAARRLGDGARHQPALRREHDLVRQSGLFDRAWLEAQLGVALASDDEAIDAYLAAGPDVSPHPLVEPAWIDPERDHTAEEPGVLVGYLTDDSRRQQSTHPAFDADRARAQLGGDQPWGPVAAWLAQAGPDSPLPTPAGTRPVTWREFRALADEWVRADGGAAGSGADTRSRPADSTTVTHSRPAADQALVSVVVATRNRSAALRPLIRSLQDQTWSAWELVVVDDTSTDDTPAVLTGAAHFDSRVVHLSGPGGGVAAARNLALEHAQGTYVAFLDPDHRWQPGFLQLMVEQLESSGRGAAHTLQGVAPDDLPVRPDLDLSTLVVRRDLLRSVGGFDESLGGASELDLALRLADQADLLVVEDGDVDRLRAPDDPYAITAGDVPPWTSVVLARQLLDWTAAEAAPTVTGRTSVVLPVRGPQVRRAVLWMDEVGGAGHGTDVELLVAATGLSESHRRVLRAAAALHESVTLAVVDSPVAISVAVDVAATCSTGTVLVVVRPGVDPDLEPLARLASALLQDPAIDVAQPVVLDPKGVVMSGGAVFGAVSRPYPFLAGHSPADAAVAEQITVPAPLGPVFAVRRETFLGLRGLDPMYDDQLAEVDLGLRTDGSSVLVTAAQVTSREQEPLRRRGYVVAAEQLQRRWPRPPGGSREAWAAAGFELVAERTISAGTPRRQPAGPTDQVFLVPRPVYRPAARASVNEPPPALRWTIDTAAPPGRRAERWGDAHFARALAESLTRQGQHVAVDSRQARHRWSRDLDDVVLVLRGLDEVAPRPGAVNIVWVISHPDLVSAEELSGFDLRYAASYTWSRRVTEQWDLPVSPLLQCTDPSLFNADRGEPDSGAPLLFVGNARNVYRSSVRSARAAGAEVTLHGGGWEQFLPPEAIASTHVANADLGVLYASAGIVLNDHWEDMRRDGFVSNRLFDATACGARVVSDEVEGLDTLFGSLVRTFHTDADMAALLAEGADGFPDHATRVELAARVAREHSFDHRAATLIADAARCLKESRADR